LKVLIITFFVVIADQISKLYVKGIKIPFLGIDTPGMPYQSSKNVIGDFFKITFIENPGMAFGLQLGGKLFLSIFTILATILLVFFLYKNRKEPLILRLALAFILGGAIGNLIDRVFYGVIYDYAPFFYGRVVDFLHFDFPNFVVFGKTFYSWPIFNIADVFVTVGFLIILFGYKKIFRHEEHKENLPAVEGIPGNIEGYEKGMTEEGSEMPNEILNDTSDDLIVENFEEKEIPPQATTGFDNINENSDVSKNHITDISTSEDKKIPDVN